MLANKCQPITCILGDFIKLKQAIIGRKIGMLQYFYPNGISVGATVIEVEPNVVTNKKTIEKDKYNSIQLGYVDYKKKKITKPILGQFAKNSVTPKKKLKEFRIKNSENWQIGDEIKLDIFNEGQFIDVTGISRGKGFTGAIKRWNLHRGPMAHGSGYHRGHGSMGQCSDPSRVYKGKKMPGHLGVDRVTVQNLEIIKIDTELNALIVKGAIPGPKNGIVYIKDTVKSRNTGSVSEN